MDRLGSRLGVGLSLAGFIVIFLGWNGAASVDRVPSQFPYLISGGVAGLGLIVLGAALIFVQAARDDSALVRAELEEIKSALEKLRTESGASKPSRTSSAPRGMVVLGPTTYHRASCRLVAERGELPVLTIEGAEERGLTACRVCDPSTPAAKRKGARRSARS